MISGEVGVDGSWSVGGGTFSAVPHSWFLCASPECSDFSCSVIFPVEPCWLLCCLPGQDTVGPDWPQLLTQLWLSHQPQGQRFYWEFLYLTSFVLYVPKLLWLHMIAFSFISTKPGCMKAIFHKDSGYWQLKWLCNVHNWTFNKEI